MGHKSHWFSHSTQAMLEIRSLAESPCMAGKNPYLKPWELQPPRQFQTILTPSSSMMCQPMFILPTLSFFPYLYFLSIPSREGKEADRDGGNPPNCNLRRLLQLAPWKGQPWQLLSGNRTELDSQRSDSVQGTPVPIWGTHAEGEGVSCCIAIYHWFRTFALYLACREVRATWRLTWIHSPTLHFLTNTAN